MEHSTPNGADQAKFAISVPKVYSESCLNCNRSLKISFATQLLWNYFEIPSPYSYGVLIFGLSLPLPFYGDLERAIKNFS